MNTEQEAKWMWAREPFGRCIEYFQEATDFAILSIEGIRRLGGAAKLEGVIESLRSFPEGKGERGESQRLKRATELAELAKEEVANRYPLLFAHTLVAVWGAVDALIDDVLVTWFLNEPQLLNKEDLSGIRVPLGKYESLDKKERMGLLVDELKRKKEARFKPGVAGFEELLGVIDLAGSLDAEMKRTLVEVRAVRNVLVHNAGVVDRRLVESCPWESWKIGGKVAMPVERYGRYHQAVNDYILTLINRVRAGVGLPGAAFPSRGGGGAAASS
jgi:hypothetical protein